MTLQILIPVVAALAGAGVAGLAGETRHYVELRRERRKALNRVLWCQLDLWTALSRYDLTGALEVVMPRFADRLGVVEADLSPANNREVVAELVADNILPDREPDLDLKYAASVEALASFEPVLAYRLSGKTELQFYREQVNSYMAAAVDRLPMEPTDPAMLKSFISFLQKEMLRTVKKILQDDMEAVGKHLNRRTRRDIKRATRSLEERIEADPKLTIEEGADRMLLWAQQQTLHRTTSSVSSEDPEC
jgi:hypothetical protein